MHDVSPQTNGSNLADLPQSASDTLLNQRGVAVLNRVKAFPPPPSPMNASRRHRAALQAKLSGSEFEPGTVSDVPDQVQVSEPPPMTDSRATASDPASYLARQHVSGLDRLVRPSR